MCKMSPTCVSVHEQERRKAHGRFQDASQTMRVCAYQVPFPGPNSISVGFVLAEIVMVCVLRCGVARVAEHRAQQAAQRAQCEQALLEEQQRHQLPQKRTRPQVGILADADGVVIFG